MQGVRFGTDEVVWLLGAACQLHRIPFDPKLVLGQHPPPHSVESLREALVSLGFRTGIEEVALEHLSMLSGPCFVALHHRHPTGTSFGRSREGGNPVSETPVGIHEQDGLKEVQPPETVKICLVLLLRSDGERVLFIEPGQVEPSDVSLAEFGERYAGSVLRFAPEAKPAQDPDASPQAAEFGFRWFVPELLKHKHIWRDILLASLAIQLVGLATPLFTQVVIDKVVVHQTMSTLAVIGVGLFVFMIFTAAMTWVRQYLVLHTGNRVDAVLGSRVFDHLLDLPPRYFDHRPTGILTARLHGVESIREFVSGAAVTLLLDLPFLFIFLAVMFYYPRDCMWMRWLRWVSMARK